MEQTAEQEPGDSAVSLGKKRKQCVLVRGGEMCADGSWSWVRVL